jgi:hypothetical protein
MKRLLTVILGTALLGLYGCFESLTGTKNNQDSKFTLTVVPSVGGSVTLSPSGGVYDSGTVVTLTPKANANNEFGGWGGDLSGSDNPATIKMNSNKNITASFSAVGGGIHGTISKDTAWDKASNVYHIDGDLTINANVTWGRKIKVIIDDGASVNVNGNGKLTIEEGVDVKLGTGSAIKVGYSTAGTIITKGTDSLMITFTRNSGVENWGSTDGGIVLYNNTTTASVIDHCIIEYATSGLFVQWQKAVITNCLIRKNKGLGIKFASNTMPKDSASFVNDSITNNGGYPISICPEGLTSLSGNTYVDSNATEGILVTGSNDVKTSGIWRMHQVPYVFDGYANIGSTAGTKITIEPGVICKFNTGSYIQAGYASNTATLIAVGTDSLPITFTKNTGVENWGSTNGGIILWEKTTDQTVFDHCIVEYASTGLHIISLKAVITNCKIRNNSNFGIDFRNKAMPKDSASFVNDSITDNGTYPFTIIAEGLSNLSGDTYIKGNKNDEIEVKGGDVTETGTWKKHNVPYLFTGIVNIGKNSGVTITINPGTVCKFVTDAYVQVGYSNPAALIANGTEKDSIVFTNKLDGSPWGKAEGGFMFWINTTEKTSLQYCVIENAKAGLHVDDVKISMSNCSVRKNTGAGITFTDQGTPKDSASFLYNNFTGNGSYGIEMYATNVGNLSGTEVIYQNGKSGILVKGSTVKTNSSWKFHNGAPYVVSGEVRVESADGTTLTIRPKVTLQFMQKSFVNVGYAGTGALIADGTAAENDPDPQLSTITFESNADGVFWGSEATNGAGIELWNGTAGTTLLKNCRIIKATAGVYVDTKTAVTIKNCFIDANKTYGIAYFNKNTPITNIADNTGSNPSGNSDTPINLHP